VRSIKQLNYSLLRIPERSSEIIYWDHCILRGRVDRRRQLQRRHGSSVLEARRTNATTSFRRRRLRIPAQPKLDLQERLRDGHPSHQGAGTLQSWLGIFFFSNACKQP